jgi:hypothetical protein
VGAPSSLHRLTQLRSQEKCVKKRDLEEDMTDLNDFFFCKKNVNLKEWLEKH